MNRWLRTLDHASITVGDLDEAMRLFAPLLDCLGYTERERGRHAGKRLAIDLEPSAQVAFGVWEAKAELARRVCVL